MPLVKIKLGLSHRNSDGEPLKAGDVFDASPAEMVSFGDKFIPVVDVVPDEPESPVVKVDATPGAHKLAEEQGVSLALSGIVGTGKDGKIIKADVTVFLNDETEAAPNGDAE